MTWNPIATAPKDRPILIIQEDVRIEHDSRGSILSRKVLWIACIAKWEDTSREVRELVSSSGNRETFEIRKVEDGYWKPITEDVFSPSHWMDLPDGPITQAQPEPAGFLSQASTQPEENGETR